jgi:hypothetical protein
MGKGKGAALAAATIATCAAAADAAVAQQAGVNYSDRFTTERPGAPSGRVLHNDYFNAADRGAKPPALKRLRIVLPAGARYDTSALPACGATDAELMARGPEACPADTKLGDEVYVFDTGFPEPNRYVTTDIDFFNERGGIIVFSQDRSAGSRVVSHGVVTERTYQLDYPPLPGTPPEGGGNRSEQATFTAATGSGGPYLRTPPSCPAAGHWTFRATFTYANGEVLERESRSPCRRAGGAPAAAQRLTFFRRQHARAGRRGRLRLRAARSTPAVITVRRRGRLVARRSVRLHAGLNRLRLPAVGRGRYRLTVSSGGVRRRARLVVS